MNFEKKEEGNEEVFNIAEIMGRAMEIARAVQVASHNMKGVEDMEGQDIFNATCKEAAEVLRKAAQAIDPEKAHAKNKEKKKKGQKKKQRSGRDGGRQEQNCLGTASRRRSSSTPQKRLQKQ